MQLNDFQDLRQNSRLEEVDEIRMKIWLDKDHKISKKFYEVFQSQIKV